MSIVLTPGQTHDGRTCPEVLGELAVGRDGPGRPRTRHDHVTADKAYSSRAIREDLRRRGIAQTIFEEDYRKEVILASIMIWLRFAGLWRRRVGRRCRRSRVWSRPTRTRCGG